MKYDIIIGIDPDSEKNGVAIVSPATRLLNCECLTFGATLAYLKRMHEATERKGYIMEIVIEAGGSIIATGIYLHRAARSVQQR